MRTEAKTASLPESEIIWASILAIDPKNPKDIAIDHAFQPRGTELKKFRIGMAIAYLAITTKSVLAASMAYGSHSKLKVLLDRDACCANFIRGPRTMSKYHQAATQNTKNEKNPMVY